MLDEEEENFRIALLAQDNSKVWVNRNDAKLSKLVKAAVESDDDAREIPISEHSEKTLAFVVEYLHHQKGVEAEPISSPLTSNHLESHCKDPWDVEFIERVQAASKQQLYDVTNCAYYMDIPCLTRLGAAKVALMIKGQPLSKIKEIMQP